MSDRQSAAAPRSPLAPGRERIATLDALRGAAILAVFCHHASPRTPMGGVGQVFLGTMHLGWAGVDLFFVLSGFLITGILLDTRERADYLPRFYARRVRRIFPLYYLALAVMIILLPLLGGWVPREAATVATSQAWYWTYLGNLKIAATARWNASYADHFWTLAVEEQFYLLWPLVVLWTRPRTLSRVCVGIIVTALAARCALVLSGTSSLAVTVFTLTRADSLAFGALPACLLRTADGDDIVRRWIPRGVAVGGSVALLIAIADVAGYVGPWWAGGGAAWATIGYSALGAAFAAVVATCAVDARRGAGEPRGRAFRFLCLTGTYSYGLYVMHAPVLYVLRDLGWRPRDWRGQLAYAAVAGIIAYGLAALSWHAFESRILARRAPVRPSAIDLAAADA